VNARTDASATYQRLKWITFAVAAAALILLQFVFFDYADLFLRPLPGWGRIVVRSGAVALGVLIFNEYVFQVISRINRALDAERERLAALHHVSRALASLEGTQRSLEPTLEVARRVVRADVATWMEQDRAGREVVCRAVAGERQTQQLDSLRVKVGQGLAGRAVSAAHLAELQDALALPVDDQPTYPVLAAEGLRSAVAVPAIASQRTVGALVVGWRRPHRLDAADRAFLENLANQLAVAVENWRLYRETQRVGALEERDRLAREMHDGLAQTLTYLKFKAEAGLQHAAAERWGSTAQSLEDIRRAAHEALADVRQAILDLRTASGRRATGDFLADLAEYLHGWSRLNGVEAELVAPSGEVRIQEDASVEVLRIVQEALTNVRKHAGAQRAWVRVAWAGDAWTVAVRDDGRGFDPEQAQRPGHFGLAVMRERAAGIGASVDLNSAPGRGTEVLIRIPVAVPVSSTMGAAG
jgi:two-component system nitrate/nitrite sensor histidine kinase NarX